MGALSFDGLFIKILRTIIIGSFKLKKTHFSRKGFASGEKTVLTIRIFLPSELSKRTNEGHSACIIYPHSYFSCLPACLPASPPLSTASWEAGKAAGQAGGQAGSRRRTLK